MAKQRSLKLHYQVLGRIYLTDDTPVYSFENIRDKEQLKYYKVKQKNSQLKQLSLYLSGSFCSGGGGVGWELESETALTKDGKFIKSTSTFSSTALLSVPLKSCLEAPWATATFS